MDSCKKCTSSPFLRGFVPGILIGLFTSVLLLSLWRTPLAISKGGSLQLVDVLQRGAASPTTNQTAFPAASNGYCGTQHLSNKPIAGSHLLLVLVHSNPSGHELRQAVRSTWLRDPSPEECASRFVIGTKNLDAATLERLACENKAHDDLLLLPEVEDGREWPGSEKLLASYVWAVKNARFQYLFKCNDATFAVLGNIVKFLLSHQLSQSLIWGFFAGGVQAAKEGRLAEKEWYLCTHYLPYPQGGGYVVSRDLVELLSVMAEDLEHYNHDDVAVGVWLSPFDGIERRHDVHFNTGYYSRGCSNAYVVTHRETPESMREKSTTLQNTGLLCEEEFQLRLSYIYNWTAPADRCCLRKPGIP